MVRFITTVLTLAVVLAAAILADAWYDGWKTLDQAEQAGWLAPEPEQGELSLFETTVAKAVFGQTWDETGFPCRTAGRLWNHYTGAPDRRGMSISQVMARDIAYEVEATQSLQSQVRQLAVACLLEGRHDDTQMLRLWLRRANFGDGMIGTEAAAQATFGKAPGALGEEEAARLAAMLYWPGTQAEQADWDRRAAIISARVSAAD